MWLGGLPAAALPLWQFAQPLTRPVWSGFGEAALVMLDGAGATGGFTPTTPGPNMDVGAAAVPAAAEFVTEVELVCVPPGFGIVAVGAAAAVVPGATIAPFHVTVLK